MKKVNILFLLLFTYMGAFGQKLHVFQDDNITNYHYFILNDIPANKKATINEVDVASNNDFGCDKKIYSAQLYNVFLSPGALVLFTVLPTNEDGNVKWKKIDINTVRSSVFNITALDSLYSINFKKFVQSGFRNVKLVKLNGFKVIIKRPDGYYVNESDCLTEFFYLGRFNANNGFVNQNPINVIDTTVSPLSIAEFEMQYKRRMDKYSYNHSDFTSISQFGLKTPILFYSHPTTINNLNCYFFWELSTWTLDIANIDRGIDRFIFNPEIGIIGGDYTFYFRKLNNSIPSSVCEQIDFYQYLNSEVKLNPVKINKDFK